MKERKVSIKRKTKETDVKVFLNLDGSGICKIESGIGFFDHLLTQFAVHGRLDLKVMAKGDLNVDDHHTVEDVGITLGKAFYKAIGDKKGIRRYGNALIPMDDALILFALDISGRPYLNFNVKFRREKVADLSIEMISEFFRAFSLNAKVTLHISKLFGENDHHTAEAIFKAFGRALREAVEREDNGIIPSTKGVL
ncbi:MAG: imidazoleglycerol-phosphate dehydratase HisB [Thermovenabulum sp.]|uniref:imidazoleglycerol-phosphate dehydratase HisB n=1 Tax=Thermovenabulum sp. TaxID=3100335 RepID=UPI003C7A5B27